MSNLKSIKFVSWWRSRYRTPLKFKTTKNNLMKKFTSSFEKTILYGRYDHFLSKSKNIKLWDSNLTKIRNMIENETTTSLSFQYGEVYLPFIYTMKNLQNLAIKNPNNGQDINEIDVSSIPNLRKLIISGTTTNVIPLKNIKNIDTLKLREITIKNCKSVNLESLDASQLRKLVIHRIDDVVKLPDLKKSKINTLQLKNLILESVAPIIKMSTEGRTWIWFENVVVLNGLTKEEEITFLNNKSIDDWTKSTIMKLLSSLPTKRSIRNR